MKLLDRIIVKFTGQEIVKFKNVKIKSSFKYVNERKMHEKRKYAEKYGFYKDEIIIDKDNYLIDGYTSYLLAKENGIEELLVTRYLE